MELNPKQQTIELLAQAKRLLLVTHAQADGDAIGSLLALKIVLEKLGKMVVAVCPTPIANLYQFLPAVSSILTHIPQQSEVIISIKTDHFKVEKLGYRHNESNKTLEIVITPTTGSIELKDLSVGQTVANFDAVVVLDTPDVDRLESLYDQNTKIFYETPVVNIDHHPSNEQFGKINWVDLVATSTAEIMVALIESLAAKMAGTQGNPTTLLDEQVATCLLVGIITDTSSFQNVNTTPKSLTVAAQLVAVGARQQEIIYHLYKVKPLSTLKLWGAVLNKITDEPNHRFIWTLAEPADFQAAKAQNDELAGLIDELLKTTRDRDFVVVFSNRGPKFHGSLRSIHQNYDVSGIANLFNGGGHPQAAAFDLPIQGGVEQTLSEVLTKIKIYVQERVR